MDGRYRNATSYNPYQGYYTYDEIIQSLQLENEVLKGGANNDAWQIGRLTQMATEAESEKNKLRKDNEALQKKNQEFQMEMRNISDFLKGCELDLQNRDAQIIALKLLIEDLKATNDRATVAEQEVNSDNTQCQIKTLKLSVGELKAKNYWAKSREGELKNENTHLRRRVHELEERLSTLQSKHDKSKADLLSSNNEIESLKPLNIIVARLESAYKSTEEKIALLNSKVAKRDDELKLLKEKNTLKLLREKNLSAKDKFLYKSRCDELEKRCDELENRYVKELDRNKDNIKEKGELKTVNRILQQEVDALRAKVYILERYIYDSQIASLLIDHDKEKKELKNEKEELSSKIKELEEKNSQMLIDHNKEKKELLSQITELRNIASENLGDQWFDRLSENFKLQDENSAMKKHVDSSTEQLETLDKVNHELSSENELLKCNITQLENTIRLLSNSISSVSAAGTVFSQEENVPSFPTHSM